VTLEIRPVTAGLWPLLETLFGPQGACYGCWCSYFRLEPKLREALSKDEKKQLARNRPRRKLAAAWPDRPRCRCSRGLGAGDAARSRAALEHSTRTVSRPMDGDDPSDPGLWAISCFFIQSRRRGEGISHALLLDAAVTHARQPMAPASSRPARSKRPSIPGPIGLYVGSVCSVRAGGFSRRLPNGRSGRPLMRKVLA
jgi:hypothetical protein